jgi:UDP-glucose 4-epimerase
MLGNDLNLLDGRSFEPQFAPARAGEVQRSALDPTRSREELGFVAETNLEDGLRRTLQSVLHEARAA